MARIRASVTSRRDGSGICGENKPSCTLLVLPGSACKRHRHNRGLRRMGFEIEMQQLDPELIIGRQRRPDGAGMRSAAFERQRDGNRSQRQYARRCAQDQLLQHQIHDEHQRIEDFYGRVQLHALFKRECRLDRLKQVRHLRRAPSGEGVCRIAPCGR